jgi:cytochrome c oxidase cbb3-type subunit 3
MSETKQDPAGDRLLDHEYDGIQEYDNPLPRWWLQIFYVTIAYAVLYFLNVPGIGIGKGRIAAYERDMAAWRAKYAVAAPGKPVDAATLLADGKDPRTYGLGKATFATNCMPCHGAAGGGVIGPNLTDDYWLHGGTPSEIWTTVHNGVLAKGMPAWGQVLPPEKVEAVAAYVITLHGTHPANPKAPQGELVPAAGAAQPPGGSDAPAAAH